MDKSAWLVLVHNERTSNSCQEGLYSRAWVSANRFRDILWKVTNPKQNTSGSRDPLDV